MRRLPSAVLAALLLAACGQPGPTWHGEIAPIVERSCSGCHAFDERTAPRQAQRMLARVEAGEMPPYLPGPGSLPFATDPRLSAGDSRCCAPGLRIPSSAPSPVRARAGERLRDRAVSGNGRA